MSHLVRFVCVVIVCWSTLSIALSLVIGRMLRDEPRFDDVLDGPVRLKWDSYPISRVKAFPSPHLAKASD